MASLSDPGRQSLVYSPAKVAWATAEFVRKPPSFAVTLGVYLIVIFGVITAVYATIARIPISIKAGGVLTTEKAPIPLVITVTGQVTSIRVAENMVVKPGDEILTTDQYLSDESFKKLSRDVKQMEAFLALDAAGRCQANCGDKIRTAAAGFGVEAKGSIRELVTQMQDLLNDYLASKTNLANLPALISEQIREIRTDEQKINAIKAQKAEVLLASDIERLEAAKGAARAQIAERQQASKSQLKASRDRLQVRLKTFLGSIQEVRAQNTVRAPVAGTVSNLRVTTAGQQVTAGSPILDLIPLKSPFIAEVAVENQDISKVAPGMAVTIKLNALSEREYGVVLGEVIDVPVNVSMDHNASYKVRVHLDRQQFTKGGKVFPFRLGMTLTAQIVAKRERLIVVALKKILNVADDLLGG